MRRHLLLLCSSIMLCLPAVAGAQNGSTPGTLELYPTLESIGVRLSYSGDANGNATARIEWRKTGDAGWALGVSMTRITNRRWAGSIIRLSPNTSYDVRGVIEDPDGGGTSASAAVRTRTTPPATATGSTWWVATNGNDSNSGSSTSPFASFAAAAARAHAGDQIRVRPGIYYQQLDVSNAGTASAPIHLLAEGPGVILDGSDPALLHRTDWQSNGGGIYSIAYSTGSNRLVCADSLMRLYEQSSLSDLQSNANGIAQGFAIENGRLYVKLEDGSNPSNHTMHVARYNVGIVLDQPYWHVFGLDIRHFGTGAGGSGIQIMSTNGCWVTGNHIYTLGGRGVFLRLGAKDNLIESNLINDPRIGTWPWSATKAHDEENAGIANRGGRGNVIRNNTIRGTFDGMDAGDGTTDENVTADSDYQGNIVTGVADDAIETDDVSAINLRVIGNTFDKNYSGISMAPIGQGPEYVLNNVITNFARTAFKFSLSGTGVGWICHNTAATTTSGSSPVHPSGPYSNLHFRNNVLVGNGISTVDDDSGESQSGNDYDGDLLYVTGTSTLFRWKGVDYSTLSALRTGTGFESNGKTADPTFTASLGGDYRLKLGSPAIDAAIVIPGINDHYVGAGPDIGALEYSSATDTMAPAPIYDLR